MTDPSNARQSCEQQNYARFTTIRYPGQLMGKEYRYESGKVASKTDGTGSLGWFQVERVHNLSELHYVLEGYDLDQIMVHGCPGAERGYVHSGVPASYMDLSEQYDIQRTMEDLPDPEGLGVVTSDSDYDSAPRAWTQHLQTPQDQYVFLTCVFPELVGIGLLVRPSGSNGIYRPDGTPHKETRNFHTHAFCLAKERSAILERLHALAVLRGYGWIMISESGALLERSPFDLALRNGNQPVFAAKPRVIEPVVNQRPQSVLQEGRPLRLADLPEFDDDEVKAAWAALKADPALLERQAAVKKTYSKKKVRKALPFGGPYSLVKAAIVHERKQAMLRAEAWDMSLLHPDKEIETIRFGTRTVAELLADPEKYHGAKTRDPIEPEYRNGAQVGILYLKGKLPVIVSLAHGGKKYALQAFEPVDFSKVSVGGVTVARPKVEDIPDDKVEVLAPARKNGLPDTVGLHEGLERVELAVRDFENNSKNVLLRSTPGSQKTLRACGLMARDERNWYLYLAPSLKLCRQSHEMFLAHGGEDGLVFLGRGQADPDNPDQTMCTRPEHIQHKLAYGTQERNMCAGCPLRGKRQCGYDRQLHYVKKTQPRVIFASHVFGHYPIPEWEPSRVVFDEAMSTAGVDMEVRCSDLDVLQMQYMPPDIRGAHAEKLFAQQLQTLPAYADYEGVTKHRYRSMILEVLAGREEGRVVWSGATAVLAQRLSYIHKDKPTLILDGTARESLVKGLFGEINTIHRVDLYRNLKVRQVLNKNPKHKFGDSWIKNLTPEVKRTTMLVAAGYGLKMTTKKSRAVLDTLDSETHPDWIHLGGSVGDNSFEHHDSAFAMLYGMPPMGAMVALAEVLSGKPVVGKEIELTEYILLRDGSMRPTVVHSHTDELVAELIRHFREDQIMQMVDRLRATLAEGDAKVLDLYCPVVLKDLPVDEVAYREDVWPTGSEVRLHDALHSGSGIVPETPTAAYKLRADIWTEGTARRDYKEFPEGWQDGLDRVQIQEKKGNKKAVWGYQLPNSGAKYRFANNYKRLQAK